MQQHSHKNKRDESQWVISYLTLRKSVGILGIALPIVLLTGFWLLDKNCDYPPSISHYYYTNLGTYFTGTLCAVALFLFSYKGPEDTDKHASLFAAICALGVAFFPANPYCNSCNNCVLVHLDYSYLRNGLHYAFAGFLFLTFAYFSLVLFTKTSYEIKPTKQKLLRNKIYKFCGWVIIICITIIGLTSIPAINSIGFIKNFKPLTFIFEAIALFAFGYSWLIKGETFFKDQ
ncbi:MAG TPA: hypothetical protein VLS85_01660 [Hanamia sp.]|nr:hypothetical protein [Hanamia sp.]